MTGNLTNTGTDFLQKVCKFCENQRVWLSCLLLIIYTNYCLTTIIHTLTKWILIVLVFFNAPDSTITAYKKKTTRTWELSFTKPSDWISAYFQLYSMQNRVDVVIAHYKEDLKWLEPYLKRINHLFLYCKDKDLCQKGLPRDLQGAQLVIHQLPNEGRESHTYLSHLINYYDKVSDRTVFTMASINGNAMRRLSFIYALSEKSPPETSQVSENEINKIRLFRMHSEHLVPRSLGDGYTPKNIIQKATHQPLNRWMWHYLQYDCLSEQRRIGQGEHGAIFSVTRQNIHQFPRALYQSLLDANKGADSMEAGYYMERLWRFMFASTPPSKEQGKHHSVENV